MNTNPLITTVRMSKACRDAVNKIAESLNVSAWKVVESALDALQHPVDPRQRAAPV